MTSKRSGDFGYSANAYRWTAFGCMALAAASITSLAWDRSRQVVIPVMIQTDSDGPLAVVGPAEMSKPPTEIQIRAELFRWIRSTRTVSVDPAFQHKMVMESYALIKPGSRAHQQLSIWFRQNEPFVRAQDETIDVTPRAARHIDGTTWQVQWSEDRRSRSGTRMAPTAEWQATITFALIAPNDLKALQDSPFGLKIEAFSWAAN